MTPPPLDLAAARKVIAEYDTNDFREGCDEFMFARHAANGWPDALNAYEAACAEVERLTKELDELLAAVVDGPWVEIRELIDREGVTLNAIARLEAERDAALLQSQAAEERAAVALDMLDDYIADRFSRIENTMATTEDEGILARGASALIECQRHKAKADALRKPAAAEVAK